MHRFVIDMLIIYNVDLQIVDTTGEAKGQMEMILPTKLNFNDKLQLSQQLSNTLFIF